MIEFNRLLWMFLFLFGTAFFAWLEWRADGSAMIFFILTSFWSAICGIGYTVMHWFIAKRTSNQEG